MENSAATKNPFAKTRAQRLAAGDPRLSLQERYKDHAGFVKAVAGAAARLVKERFLLDRDAMVIVETAQRSAILR